ncbi:hypothetical protein DRO02_04160 [archaeon]|nr:MAG: hypothetical protein DRO02_04160 [archaeon]RLG64906.1 MAG: hypothetical protein DRO21_03115 [archaeon]HDM24034.1 GNAT family N-acetyltransferase [Candidatus Bathyarchaeota archaeon]
MRIKHIDEEKFWSVAYKFNSKVFDSFNLYRLWFREASHLRVFWAREGIDEKYMGITGNKQLVGVFNFSKVRFYERKSWGSNEKKYRMEIRELYFLKDEDTCIQSIVDFMHRTKEVFGVSSWLYHEELMKTGLDPYARSIVIAWDTKTDVKKYNRRVKVKATKEVFNLSVLKEIQHESWSFFMRPDPKRHVVLIAYLDDEAVGSAYLNVFSGNIDYGVHVKRDYWNQGIGSSILRKALEFYRRRNFKHMFVIRVLSPITRVGENDRRALSFYISRGGKVIRDYVGFRFKKRGRVQLPRVEAYFK